MTTCTASPIAQALLKNIMKWDSSEGIWELRIPVPSQVTLFIKDMKPVPEIGETTLVDALVEVDEAIELQEGLDYVGTSLTRDAITIYGLRWG